MKTWKTLATGAAIALFAVAPVKAETFINILTGGTSGVYYPLGVALSQIYTDKVEGARPSVQATKASVENLNLLQDGKGEIAFVLGDAVALADLKGKRLSVGAPASGTELNARAILAAAGMKYEDLGQVEYLPFAESVELMKNRQLDATLQSAGLGVASIRDLATSVPITVVEVPADVIAAVGAPYLSATIPAGTYEGQDADVATAAVQNYLVTHSDVAEDVVYGMTKSLFENLDAMVAAHAAAKAIKLEGAGSNPPAPLHPGAERYFKEAGAL